MHLDASYVILQDVRTTIDLDEPLLNGAKRIAAAQGRTLSQVVCEAVGTYLATRPVEDEKPFELITCGEPGGHAPTPAEIAAELESDDARAVPRRRTDADS